MEIIEFLRENDLLTSTRTNDKAIENFKKGADAKFIITNGIKQEMLECSRCRRILESKKFSYYKARVGADGYLNRTNALCSDCAKESTKKRLKIFAKERDNIPPKPASGSVCPRCNRKWHKQWHRDHDDATNTFRGWICGNCNMSKGDQRNPHLSD